MQRWHRSRVERGKLRLYARLFQCFLSFWLIGSAWFRSYSILSEMQLPRAPDGRQGNAIAVSWRGDGSPGLAGVAAKDGPGCQARGVREVYLVVGGEWRHDR